MPERDPIAPYLILGATLAAPGRSPDADGLTRQARTAEDAGLDLVVVADGGLDAPLTAARLAAQTRRIGVLAEASTTTTEPFHVSTQIATIDSVSGGRGGWLTGVTDPRSAQQAVSWTVPDDPVGDAAEHVQVVRALWDSWEHDAEIRDATTSRFLDRDRVHRVDFRGRHIAVRGPSITPRPPQGHPVVAVRVRDAATWALAAEHGDLAVTDGAVDPPDSVVGRVPWLATVEAAGRDTEDVAGAVAAHRRAGAIGVLLAPVPDLSTTLAGLLPALERHGLGVVAPSPRLGDGDLPRTLRERLGLAPIAGHRSAA